MSNNETFQFSTFKIGGRWYAIDVAAVQEIVKPMPMTKIPLVPDYISGLINLRGQVATAISLKKLFKIDGDSKGDLMNVVCDHKGSLISLQVEEIGDVLEVDSDQFEVVPQTLPESIKTFLSGIYKTADSLMSVVDINNVTNFLNNHNRV